MDGIEYYITDAFGEGMYESCKNVKFGSSNSLAVDFLGGGAKNFKGKAFIRFSYLILLSRITKLHVHVLSCRVVYIYRPESWCEYARLPLWDQVFADATSVIWNEAYECVFLFMQ